MTALTRPPTLLEHRFRTHGWWRDTTFLDDLRGHAEDTPHHLAVAGRRLAAARTETLAYADLSRLVDRYAGGLLELGVRRGDVVAVQLPNRWEMVALMFACVAAGAVITPVTPIAPKDELKHRLTLTGASVCVTIAEWDGRALGREAADLIARLPTLEHVLVLDGGPVPAPARSFTEHFGVAWEDRYDLAGRRLGPDEPFVVLFTSGTTGESKGVTHSCNTLHAALHGYIDTLGLDREAVIVATTPMVHYSGFAQAVLGSVMLGGTVVFQDGRWNPGLLDMVERHGGTLLYGPPPTITDIVAAQRDRPRAVGTLRQVVIGSAPVLPGLVKDVRETLAARTHSLWGMTENGPVTITRLLDPDDWAAHSNGTPVKGMGVRVDTCDDPARRAKVGRLRVRGASQALGYWGRAGAYAAELTGDGWFHTGDIARTDGRGGIRILGRARDVVVRDGELVPMVELEALLAAHPVVTEAALVGLDGVLCVIVVPSADTRVTLDMLHDHLRSAGVADRFWPDRVEVVDALPKTLTGKVRKARLRERLASGVEV